MARAVLITQCLQRDFVGPVPPHAPLPNRLHVGREESLRLLGPEPESGPLAQLMSWARERAGGALRVLHVRDWHDPADPRQSEHLGLFGDHCLAGTPGAQLVLDLDPGVAERPEEWFVDASGLNDFVDTGLEAQLRALRAAADGPLRIGVVGVWTEAKVTFLLYDLRTRLGPDVVEDLATCSALTASASRAQHFNALEQLRRILGVQVFEGVGDFARWLVPDGPAVGLPPVTRTGPRPQVSWTGEPLPLCAEDETLLAHLYRDSARLELSALSGGFSGAGVLRARSFDAWGHEHAPSVVKLGPRGLIAHERVAFERVEDILGNCAPAVRGFADLGERAGLKYAYASMGGGRVRTFKALYEGGGDQSTVDRVLETVFEEVLGRFYSAARYERWPLLERYGFRSAFAAGIRARAAELGAALGDERLSFPGGYTVDHPARFYDALDTLPTADGECRYVSYVHGDLNGANILLDGRDNVWLIDFYHTERAHVLKDVAKLENDLLYIFTPLQDEAELEQALRITRALREVRDLAAPLGQGPALESPALRRAWATLQTLRRLVSKLCREDRHPLQLSIALLRYAAHTLSFDESSPLQRRWALAAAGGHGEDVARTIRRDVALRVDWLDPALTGGRGRLGLTLCPGRSDKGRDLATDVAALQAAGARHLLCVATAAELEQVGAATLPDAARAAGLGWKQLPVPDQGAPSIADARLLLEWLDERLAAGEDVVVHCVGGLGRSGTVAATLLVRHGLGPAEAIAAVRLARDPRAVESAVQERFVETFASVLR